MRSPDQQWGIFDGTNRWRAIFDGKWANFAVNGHPV